MNRIVDAAFIACIGNTPGKQILGIKIVDIEGRSINFQRAFKRDVLFALRRSLFCKMGFYKKLIQNKMTTLDKQINHKVSYRVQPLWITFVSVLILTVLFVVSTLLPLFYLGYS